MRVFGARGEPSLVPCFGKGASRVPEELESKQLKSASARACRTVLMQG